MNKNAYFYNRDNDRINKACSSVIYKRYKQFERGLITCTEFLFFMEETQTKFKKMKERLIYKYLINSVN